ncbi:hypothetical protein TNIN_272331 [Trichonephila inaurata madagascariensis]|uniref:Uncharacterized protein n=1 Tax=Trichonephila inaurata madagascariensis TaxID=2747483 RepID=A0A8X6IWJ5_9ARAC|nr:hypothetical protein TNIN_296481 [Trichonephila inaurata madagascariensis]GFY70058.1 hypothetical protein TNIN_272331 [Trichonephila inaurata madagascariensis]
MTVNIRLKNPEQFTIFVQFLSLLRELPEQRSCFEEPSDTEPYSQRFFLRAKFLLKRAQRGAHAQTAISRSLVQTVRMMS